MLNIQEYKSSMGIDDFKYRRIKGSLDIALLIKIQENEEKMNHQISGMIMS